jgi:hypothetical protein
MAGSPPLHRPCIVLNEHYDEDGAIVFKVATEMSTLPPHRPFRETLLLSAAVITVTALAAVILWAVTSWLWLVVHQGLH